MPSRRYVWSHPLHSLYTLRDSRVPVRLVVELKRSTKRRKRPVYQWHLFVGDADYGAFRSMSQAEAAVPDDAIHGAVVSQPQESNGQ